MEKFLDFFLQHREAIFIVILSIFLGIEVISNVPAILHTPLMSGANAIHGVVIIGAIIVLGHAEYNRIDDSRISCRCIGYVECCGWFCCHRQDAGDVQKEVINQA